MKEYTVEIIIGLFIFFFCLMTSAYKGYEYGVKKALKAYNYKCEFQIDDLSEKQIEVILERIRKEHGGK